MGFLPSDVLKNISRDRAVVAYKAHNLGVGGSNPPPASTQSSVRGFFVPREKQSGATVAGYDCPITTSLEGG